MEELQGVPGYRDLKSTVYGGDGTDLKLRHSNLDIFHGLAPGVDDSPFDNDAFPGENDDGEQQ